VLLGAAANQALVEGGPVSVDRLAGRPVAR
jgi:hypothetical protein